MGVEITRKISEKQKKGILRQLEKGEKEIEKDNLDVEVSKTKRNNLIHFLKIPHLWGKNVEKITIKLGEDIGKKSYNSGIKSSDVAESLGQAIAKNIKYINIKVVDKSKE